MQLAGLGPQVSISYCNAVTDAGIVGLAQRRPQLEALRMDELNRITDASITALAASCKHLRVRSCLLDAHRTLSRARHALSQAALCHCQASLLLTFLKIIIGGIGIA